jgi:tetratricopeptide (TPR) repeat protein
MSIFLMIFLEFKYIGIFFYTLSSSSEAFQIYLTLLLRNELQMRFVVATFAALILVLSTAIIGSGHIALADNHNFTRDFSNSGNNKDVPKLGKDFLTPYYKGMAYLNAGNYTEVIPFFDKALAINPNYSLTLNNKGAALYGLGRYNESIAYFDKALFVNPGYTTALYNKGAALSKLGIYNESIAYFDKVLAIQPTNTLALAGKKLDLAAFNKTNIITKSTGTIAAPQNRQSSEFGYYLQKRETASSHLTNTHTQKTRNLTCDQPGHTSCYSIGYSNGLLNTRVSCSTMLLNTSANPSQINNYCLGYKVAAQHMLQQQLPLSPPPLSPPPLSPPQHFVNHLNPPPAK